MTRTVQIDMQQELPIPDGNSRDFFASRILPHLQARRFIHLRLPRFTIYGTMDVTRLCRGFFRDLMWRLASTPGLDAQERLTLEYAQDSRMQDSLVDGLWSLYSAYRDYLLTHRPPLSRSSKDILAHPDGTISRGNLWRQQYRDHQYATHLTQRELNRRWLDILLNTCTLSQGKIALSRDDPQWLKLQTHTMEAMELTGTPIYPEEMTLDSIKNKWLGPLGRRASQACITLGDAPFSDSCIFRYGERRWMKKLYEDGEIQISPASSYNDRDFNAAIFDDEQRIDVSALIERGGIRIVSGAPPIRRSTLRLKSEGDFWVSCFSTIFDERLFAEMEYDACIVVEDKDSFCQRLSDAARTHSSLAECHFGYGNALYLDPLGAYEGGERDDSLGDISLVESSKYYGYAYQKEYRFVWQPKMPQDKLEQVKLYLGPIKDIARFVAI